LHFIVGFGGVCTRHQRTNVGIDYSHDLTLTIIDVGFINSSSNTGTTHMQNI
jgi:hypothetical protein